MVASGFLLGGLILKGQTTTPPTRPYPDILTSQTQASLDLQSYKRVVEQYGNDDYNNILQQQALTASLPQDEANIKSLQTLTANLPQDEANIQALQAAVKQLQAQGPGTPAAFTLSVTNVSDGSDTNGNPLSGATVSGKVWIFTSQVGSVTPAPQGSVSEVLYTLDGKVFHVENGAPFDFNGSGATGGWNSTSVPNGPHVITQTVVSSTATETDTVQFTVAN